MRFILALLLILLLVGCKTQAQVTDTPTPTLTAADFVPFVGVSYSAAGECPGGVCALDMVIGQDGRIRLSAARFDHGVVASLTDDELRALHVLIDATDFDALREIPFTGDCRTLDQHYSYAFHAADGSVAQSLASCEVVIHHTHPLIAWLDALMTRIEASTPTQAVTANPDATATASLTPIMSVHPLVSVQRQGGRCRSGECQLSMMINTVGNIDFHDSANGETIRQVGILSADELTELRTLITQTDFAAIEAVPFTGTCPTAYDGQEVVYEFYEEHYDGPLATLASCEVVIDPTLPLFAWLNALWARVYASTTTPDATANPNATANASPTPGIMLVEPLVLVWWHGGLCTYGECTGMLSIESSGEYFTGRYNEAQTVPAGTLTEAEMAELRGLIAQTDFDALRATPFTETCPTAYDGQEVIYTINVDGIAQTLASCEVVIDHTHPLIAWLDALMARVHPSQN